MNYITEMNAFYVWLEFNPLSANAQALWHKLMNLSNKLGWRRDFSVANTMLCEWLGIHVTSLQRARDELCQAGLINYTAGGMKKSGTYALNCPSEILNSTNDVQDDVQKQGDFEHHSDTLNKTNQNKTEQTRERATREENPPSPQTDSNKKAYGEFLNVFLTDDEYALLEAKYDHLPLRIEELSQGIAAKGYKYPNHYAAIISWADKPYGRFARVNEAAASEADNVYSHAFKMAVERQFEGIAE